MATGGRSGGDSDGGSEPGVDQRRSSGRIGCRALQMVSNLSSNLGVGNEGELRMRAPQQVHNNGSTS